MIRSSRLVWHLEHVLDGRSRIHPLLRDQRILWIFLALAYGAQGNTASIDSDGRIGDGSIAGSEQHVECSYPYNDPSPCQEQHASQLWVVPSYHANAGFTGYGDFGVAYAASGATIDTIPFSSGTIWATPRGQVDVEISDDIALIPDNSALSGQQAIVTVEVDYDALILATGLDAHQRNYAFGAVDLRARLGSPTSLFISQTLDDDSGTNSFSAGGTLLFSEMMTIGWQYSKELFLRAMAYARVPLQCEAAASSGPILTECEAWSYAEASVAVTSISAVLASNNDPFAFSIQSDSGHDYGNPATVPSGLTPAISPVPVPGAIWLFGSALGFLGWLQRMAK